MAPSPLSSPVPPRVRNVLDRITPPTPLLEPDEILLEPLEQLLREAGRFRLLEPHEEIELAQRIERGDLAAKDRLINCNLRLVVSVARKYQGQRSEEHTSELQSRQYLVCRLLL